MTDTELDAWIDDNLRINNIDPTPELVAHVKSVYQKSGLDLSDIIEFLCSCRSLDKQ